MRNSLRPGRRPVKISQNSPENGCVRIFFKNKIGDRNLNKKETLAQMFSCEFKIFKNNFFTEHLRVTAYSD